MKTGRLFVVAALTAFGVAALLLAALILAHALSPLSFETLAEIAGSISSGVALVGLAYGMILQQRSAQDAADISAAHRQIEIDKMFVEHPDLRRYFLSGKDIAATDPDCEKVMAAAATLANFFDYYFINRDRYKHGYENAMWESYIRDHITGSPALRRHIADRKAWHTPAFCHFVEEHSSIG